MHGGRIFVRGKVASEQLGPGAAISPLNSEDEKEVRALLEDFKRAFGTEVPYDVNHFVKVAPSSSRPFSGYYDKTNV